MGTCCASSGCRRWPAWVPAFSEDNECSVEQIIDDHARGACGLPPGRARGMGAAARGARRGRQPSSWPHQAADQHRGLSSRPGAARACSIPQSCCVQLAGMPRRAAAPEAEKRCLRSGRASACAAVRLSPDKNVDSLCRQYQVMTRLSSRCCGGYQVRAVKLSARL